MFPVEVVYLCSYIATWASWPMWLLTQGYVNSHRIAHSRVTHDRWAHPSAACVFVLLAAVRYIPEYFWSLHSDPITDKYWCCAILPLCQYCSLLYWALASTLHSSFSPAPVCIVLAHCSLLALSPKLSSLSGALLLSYAHVMSMLLSNVLYWIYRQYLGSQACCCYFISALLKHKSDNHYKC